MLRYGINELIPAKLRPQRQDEPIDHPMIRNEIARVQRIVEGQRCRDSKRHFENIRWLLNNSVKSSKRDAEVF